MNWVRGPFHDRDLSMVPLTQFECAECSGQPSPRKRGEGTAMRASIAAPSKHASSFSRVITTSEVCSLSLSQEEGGGAPTGARVQRHPFCERTMTQARASPRREAFAVCAPGDARLSALHRGDLLAPGPPWPHLQGVAHERCPSTSALLRSQVPLVVAGGRCCPVASRASVCIDKLAGRRIPSCLSNASRKHPRRTGRGHAAIDRR